MHDALRNARNRNDRLVLPATVFVEILVGPSRAGAKALAAVRAVVQRLPLEI